MDVHARAQRVEHSALFLFAYAVGERGGEQANISLYIIVDKNGHARTLVGSSICINYDLFSPTHSCVLCNAHFPAQS